MELLIVATLIFFVIGVILVERFRQPYEKNQKVEENMKAEIDESNTKLEADGNFNLTQREEPKKKSNKRKPKQKI
jgi:hypothetical protein